MKEQNSNVKIGLIIKMKLLLILLFPLFLSSQSIGDRWNKLPSETKSNLDHTFDWWSSFGFSWGIGELVYAKTDRMGVAALSGIAANIPVIILERGLYGKGVRTGGTLTGAMVFRVRIDIRDRRREERMNNRRKVEQIKKEWE